ncbi:hypothetical protein AC629_29410 [Bradyrhizobium sp. NAS80.1]|nr:hypothetical protein AC629_29410 [Bradyrhizobium sp. NAS80.1]
MMDELNVPASSPPQRSRIKLTLDGEQCWAELIRQETDVTEYVDQGVRGRLGTMAPVVDHISDFRYLLREH